MSRHGLGLIHRSESEIINISASKHPQAWQVYALDGQTLVPGERLPLTRACRGEEVRNEKLLIRDGEGRLFPILCNAGPIRTEGGEVIGGVIAWRDFTDMQRLLDAAEKARLEADAATRAKDVFMAKLSHDLRTPLGSVLGWLKIARARIDDPGQLRRALDVIERNTKMQVRLVDDLLDQSRITSGHFQLRWESTNVSEVLMACVDAMQPLAAERGIALLSDIQQLHLPVRGDAARLHQVFCNLVGNAIKFSPADSDVRISARANERAAVIEVADSGIGIDRKHLDQVFEPFWQVPGDTHAHAGGLGLGLSIVRHLAHAHGGSVTARSDGLGAGATFQVTLPLLSREDHPSG